MVLQFWTAQPFSTFSLLSSEAGFTLKASYILLCLYRPHSHACLCQLKVAVLMTHTQSHDFPLPFHVSISSLHSLTCTVPLWPWCKARTDSQPMWKDTLPLESGTRAPWLRSQQTDCCSLLTAPPWSELLRPTCTTGKNLRANQLEIFKA